MHDPLLQNYCHTWDPFHVNVDDLRDSVAFRMPVRHGQVVLEQDFVRSRSVPAIFHKILAKFITAKDCAAARISVKDNRIKFTSKLKIWF